MILRSASAVFSGKEWARSLRWKPRSAARLEPVERLFRAYESSVYRRIDRLFLILLLAQWVLGIVFALLISPTAWIGPSHVTHPHVYAAVALGGIFALFPILLIRWQPCTAVTRHAVAIGQMCFSSLLIHLSGGRIETHFHVFGSLAFLACYRDWKVLPTATVIVAADHLFRGIWYPESVYGVAFSTPWRTLEHAAWVVFECVVLVWSCFVSRKEMWSICEQQHQNQELLNDLEDRVRDRTRELRAEVADRQRAEASLRISEERYRTLVENAPIGIYRCRPDGRIETANPALVAMLGVESVDALLRDQHALDWTPGRDDHFQRLDQCGVIRGYESVWRRLDGTEINVRENGRVTRDASGVVLFYEGTVEDVTERKRSEQELKELNQQLMNASRAAGMAEVATGVLHNVGNVLNSVNVSTTLIRDGLRHSRVQQLNQVVAMLQAEQSRLGAFLTSDPKGRQLPKYLERLAQHLGEEIATLLKETDALDLNVQHIKQIVAMQQGFARVIAVTECVPAEHLMEEALQLHADAFERHGIRLVREYSPVPPVFVDRHKVLQILVNLLRNAKQALAQTAVGTREITLAISSVGDSHVRLSVRDNGSGIEPQNRTRIFRHGFTTRKDGHGFGLHAGALAAREMGGSLSAHSDGPGCGATFILELPVQHTASTEKAAG